MEGSFVAQRLSNELAAAADASNILELVYRPGGIGTDLQTIRYVQEGNKVYRVVGATKELSDLTKAAEEISVISRQYSLGVRVLQGTTPMAERLILAGSAGIETASVGAAGGKVTGLFTKMSGPVLRIGSKVMWVATIGIMVYDLASVEEPSLQGVEIFPVAETKICDQFY